MAQSALLPSLGNVLAIAFAGTDLLVHIVCDSPSGTPVKLALEYPTFSRLLRERADRSEAIKVLSQFRGKAQENAPSEMRQWNLIDVVGLLGCGLRLKTHTPTSETHLQCAA